MNSICKRIGAIAMAAALTASIGANALAYSIPDFTDVPAENWAYEPVMRMADAGVIKGTGGLTFSPGTKLSTAMFLTLVGRAVYENDVKPTAEDNWFSAYVRSAQEKGLLAGTAITAENAEEEVTRYDMSVILAHIITDILNAPAKEADIGKIADYGDIPTKYAEAVAQVYAQGLITGDGAGNFNGAATMRRDEAATVLDRLITLRDAVGQQPTTPTEPEEPKEPEIPPRTGEMVTVEFEGCVKAFYDGVGDKYAAGALVIFTYVDGRELGRATTDKNGIYHISTSIDKADYSLEGELYHLNVYYTDPDGVKMSNVGKSGGYGHTNDLYQATRAGWNITLNDFDDSTVKDF